MNRYTAQLYNIGLIVYHFLLIGLLVKSDKQLYQIVIKLLWCDQCEMTIAVFPSKVVNLI